MLREGEASISGSCLPPQRCQRRCIFRIATLPRCVHRAELRRRDDSRDLCIGFRCSEWRVVKRRDQHATMQALKRVCIFAHTHTHTHTH